jgi:hypothetical protein
MLKRLAHLFYSTLDTIAMELENVATRAKIRNMDNYGRSMLALEFVGRGNSFNEPLTGLVANLGYSMRDAFDLVAAVYAVGCRPVSDACVEAVIIADAVAKVRPGESALGVIREMRSRGASTDDFVKIFGFVEYFTTIRPMMRAL